MYICTRQMKRRVCDHDTPAYIGTALKTKAKAAQRFFPLFFPFYVS